MNGKKDKPVSGIVFSLKERQIYNKIVAAANDTCKLLGIKGPYSYPMYCRDWVGMGIVQQVKPFFDLYRLVINGNLDAVRRVTGADPGKFIETYNYTLADYPKVEFTPEEANALHERIKEEIKDYIAENKHPARKLYIADQHFYHNRLCAEMDKRGFSDFEEMNDHMVRQWNAKVNPKDEVYILGDFSIAKRDATEKILRKLNGKLYLIAGNHDRFLEDKSFDRSRFLWIKDYAEIRDSGRIVILSHYPVFCYKGQYRKDKDGRPLVYMLYGHVHDTHDEHLVHRFIRETESVKVMSRQVTKPSPIPCNMINCFCMFSDYQPMTLNEWIEIDRKRRERLDCELAVYSGMSGLAAVKMEDDGNETDFEE